jgi:putative spermidine/putrescine transport system permease protein
MMRLMRSDGDLAAGAVYLAVLALAAVFAALPILVSIILSFDGRTFIGPFPPQSLSLRWYAEFLNDSYYHEGLKTSLLVSGIATLVSTVTGVAAAVALDRFDFPGRQALQALLVSPLVIPTVVIGFAMLMFASRIGIVDGLPRLIMGHIIITLPYVVRTTLASLVGIRPSLFEAALSLGATPAQALLKVTLPLAKTGIVAGAIFAFVMSFDEVAVSLFLSDPFVYTLPVALLAQMRADLNLTVAAVSVIFLVFTLLLIWLLDRTIGLDRLVGQGIYRV